MKNQTEIKSPECQKTQNLLSDYMENTLSGREAWSVEKHLTLCQPCATSLRELQATVSLLQAAPRLDTSHDFMARLHAQLDNVEPEAQSPLARFAGWRDRMADFGVALRNPRVPAIGFSLSAVALIAALAVNQFAPGNSPVNNAPVSVQSPAAKAASAQTLNHNVALSASNPFDDPAAANLEAQSQPDANEQNADNENAGS